MSEFVADTSKHRTGPAAKPAVGSHPSLGAERENVPEGETLATRLRLLWNERRVVLRATAAGVLLSTLFAFLTPKRFESTTRLMPPDQMNTGMAMLAAAGSRADSALGSGLGSVAGDLLGLKNTGELFIGILQSRTVEDGLIGEFNLRKLYKNRLWEDARKNLAKNTEVSEDRKSGIITIRVTDRDPRRAAAMGQAYLEELNNVVTQLNTSSAHRERIFLEERLLQVRQDLETAEKGFSEFASKNTAIDIEAQGKAMIEAAAGLEGQLIAAQTELQGLKQVYADSNVRVRATQARVDELQRQLQKIGGKFDSAIESADQTEQVQTDQVMYPSIRKLPLLGVSYADLYRNTKVQEAVFETLTQEYELAKVEEAKETPSVKVIDPPDVPERKSFPPRLLIMLLGTTMAASVGIGWVLAKQLWDKTDAQEPHKALALEVFGAARDRFQSSQNGVGIANARLPVQGSEPEVDATDKA